MVVVWSRSRAVVLAVVEKAQVYITTTTVRGVVLGRICVLNYRAGKDVLQNFVLNLTKALKETSIMD